MIGGGTYCLLNILKEIDRSKYKPVVLLRTTGDLVQEIDKLGIAVYYMPSMTLVPYNQSLFSRGTVLSYMKIKRSLVDFKNIINQLNVDAVYFNTMMLSPYLQTAKDMGVKTFIHLREHWPLNEHKYQLKNIQNNIAKYADEIIAINSYSASMIPNRSATIVYDWIDMESRYEYMPFEKIIKGYREDTKVYLFTGGIQEIKGTCEVINLFKNKLQGEDRRLLLVGVEEQPSRKGLKNNIKFYLSKIGIYSYEYKAFNLIKQDSRIICMPPNYALKHIMQQCYCNLSYFKIPHANLALAESIIVGTVSVAASTPESLEYSDNGNLAILYEINNEADMLEKLHYLDENYEQVKINISVKNNVVKDKFDSQRNASILASIYDRLLS